MPGYQYCGPGTRFNERLVRGEPIKNPLDATGIQHDIPYRQHPDDLKSRKRADKQLEEAAWYRYKSKDTGIGQPAAAWLVTNILKEK